MDSVQLKYQTSKTVNLDVLAIHGLAEPDHLVKFPGIVHEFLDGSLAEQIAGSRRNGTIDFQVMSDTNVRKAVDWWNDPDRLVVCLAAAPGSPVCTMQPGGTLVDTSTYLYKIGAIDIVGESIASAQVTSGVVSAPDQTAELTWAAVTGARKYKIYRKKDAEAWKVLDYTRSLTYSDTGAVTPLKTADPLAAASEISVITEGDFELKWMFDTELGRMLSVPFREASIFLRASGFPV